MHPAARRIRKSAGFSVRRFAERGQRSVGRGQRTAGCIRQHAEPGKLLVSPFGTLPNAVNRPLDAFNERLDAFGNSPNPENGRPKSPEPPVHVEQQVHGPTPGDEGADVQHESRIPRRHDFSSALKLLLVQRDQLHCELLRQSHINGITATDPLSGRDLRSPGCESLGNGEKIDDLPGPKKLHHLARELRISETSAQGGGYLRQEDDRGDDQLISPQGLPQPSQTGLMAGIIRPEERYADAGVDDRHASGVARQ
jgi:hypothetical protein